MPLGLTYISDDSNGAYNQATGKWTIGDMLNGEKKTIIIKAKATTYTKVINVATIFTDTQDPTPNPPKEVPVDPNGTPDAKDDLGKTKANLPITMSLVDGGKGKIDANSIDNSVADTDPDNDQLIITKINDQAVKAGSIIAIDAKTSIKVNSDLKTVTIITTDTSRTADIKFTYTISDSNGGTDTANVIVTLSPQMADLGIKKIVTGNNNLLVNQEVNYELTITNYGPDMAEEIEIEDIFPSTLAFISSSADQYNPALNPILKVKELKNGDTYKVSIKALILSDGTIENTGKVKSKTPDPEPLNNKSTVTIKPTIPAKPTPRTGGENQVLLITLLSILSIGLILLVRKNKEDK